MPALSALSRPAFYIKLAELGLCIAGTIFYLSYLKSMDKDRSKEIALTVAVPNGIITSAVLLLLIVANAQYGLLELCLNGTEGVMNLVLGILIAIEVNDDSCSSHFTLAWLMIACGIVMLLDCIRVLTY